MLRPPPWRLLQIALSPYRAVITSGNAPIPPGRRVQKASSDTALGHRSAATRSTTSPVVPGGLCDSRPVGPVLGLFYGVNAEEPL